MNREDVTNPIHTSGKDEVDDLSKKMENELPISELYIEKDGRKEKEILIFRIKNIPDHILSKWMKKKNEIVRETCVEQYFEEMHCKSLYMLQYYGVVARGPGDMETWMRSVPFNVLTFEAITSGVLDMDYAPVSNVIQCDGCVRRIWMNVSQEGASTIDDLRECGQINGLKVQTKEFLNQTMFQVSERGFDLLECIPQKWKDEVDEFLFHYSRKGDDDDEEEDGEAKSEEDDDKEDPFYVEEIPNREIEIRDTNGEVKKPKERMLQVKFNGEYFIIFNDEGLQHKSNVTETEDVSYCSSPYLPLCVRSENQPFKPNAYRAHECAGAESQVEDELDEIMALKECMCMVAEYIPFGTNQLVGLNERLGALDRCQGGFFTNTQDAKPTDTKFEIPAGMTDVRILDFDFTNFINFEAHIQFPEEPGIVQVEEFGMHLNVDGTIIYGLRVDAIEEKLSDNISVDSLSRMLVDVHQDSTKIMGDMLTPYQKSLMDVVFNGDTDNRGKYNVLIADEICPANGQEASFDYLNADAFLDRGEVENELKQVLGDIESSTIIGGRNVLLIGRGGTLFAGPDAHLFEIELVLFARILVREKFLGFFFSRTFAIDAILNHLRTLIINYYKDPKNTSRGKDIINNITRVSILMRETLGYLNDSLYQIRAKFIEKTLPPMGNKTPAELTGDVEKDEKVLEELSETLDNVGRLQTLMYRTRDLEKLLHGIDHAILILQSQMFTVSKIQTEDVVKSIDANFKALVVASGAVERSAISSKIMELIFSADFAFRLIDQTLGNAMFGNTGPHEAGFAWINDYYWDIVVDQYPGLMWALNLLWCFIFILVLRTFLDYIMALQMDARLVSAEVNLKGDVSKFYEVMSDKMFVPNFIESFVERKSLYNPGRHVVTFQKNKWSLIEQEEYWKGAKPKLTFVFDPNIGFLLKVRIEWNNQFLRETDQEVWRLVWEYLYKIGVFDTKFWEDPDYTGDGKFVPNMPEKKLEMEETGEDKG